VVLDEAKLHVQADVLVDVADGVVRLGAEDRSHLEDALKDADHDLLVELRALRQEGRAAKVVELKDVGPALRGRGDDLGRLHFGEAAGVQRGPEAGHRRRGQPEDGPPRRMAVGTTAWSSSVGRRR
jgi:hypothetical protein